MQGADITKNGDRHGSEEVGVLTTQSHFAGSGRVSQTAFCLCLSAEGGAMQKEETIYTEAPEYEGGRLCRWGVTHDTVGRGQEDWPGERPPPLLPSPPRSSDWGFEHALLSSLSVKIAQLHMLLIRL